MFTFNCTSLLSLNRYRPPKDNTHFSFSLHKQTQKGRTTYSFLFSYLFLSIFSLFFLYSFLKLFLLPLYSLFLLLLFFKFIISLFLSFIIIYISYIAYLSVLHISVRQVPTSTFPRPSKQERRFRFRASQNTIDNSTIFLI